LLALWELQKCYENKTDYCKLVQDFGAFTANGTFVMKQSVFTASHVLSLHFNTLMNIDEYADDHLLRRMGYMYFGKTHQDRFVTIAKTYKPDIN